MTTGIYRNCLTCGRRYEIDDEEIADQSYSPDCTDCLRDRNESNQPADLDHAERPIGELN